MRTQLNRRDFVKGAGATGMAGLAGCLGSVGGGGRGDIMLGILMGVTGGLEQLGPPIRDSAQLAAQQVNDADVDFTVDVQFEDTPCPRRSPSRSPRTSPSPTRWCSCRRPVRHRPSPT